MVHCVIVSKPLSFQRASTVLVKTPGYARSYRLLTPKNIGWERKYTSRQPGRLQTAFISD